MYTANATQVAEFALHAYCAEASTLELPVGHFPPTLATDLGNRQPFVLRTLQGDVAFYQQANGCIRLNVFND